MVANTQRLQMTITSSCKAAWFPGFVSNPGTAKNAHCLDGSRHRGTVVFLCLRSAVLQMPSPALESYERPCVGFLR
jgi:hypothetical protein